ncbi:MAG: hypothetical protein ABI663_23390 [Chryseolinea sp.]
MKITLILASLAFLILQCSSDVKTSILGSWKVDSVYTYYNGFSFTRKDIEEEPLLDYLQDGKLKMTKGEESRLFLFEIPNQDSLLHRNSDHSMLEKFFILKLSENQLIVRKEMNPVFRGNNQERYEIKYLSKYRGE